MTWLTVKTFFKKCWTWLKHNWKAPLIIVYTIVLWLIFRRKDDAMKVLEVRTESYKNQIDAINKSHEQELKKQEELYMAYLSTMKRLEKDHETNLDSLDKEKKKKLDEMVKRYKGSPEELANELSEMFGVKNG